MIRLLTLDDVKEEYREIVNNRISCPVINRSQSVLLCFACSSFLTCTVPRKLGIQHLHLEDIVFDLEAYKKSLSVDSFPVSVEPRLPIKKQLQTKETQEKEKSKEEKKQLTLKQKKEEKKMDYQNNENFESVEGEAPNMTETPLAESEPEAPLAESEPEAPKVASRGKKKLIVLEYLKEHENAKAKEVSDNCGVSVVYASKCIKEFLAQ